MHVLKTALLFGGVLGLSISAAQAATYQLEAKGGAFAPASIQLPAGQKIELQVKNSGPDEVEFESYKLNIEQKISAGDSQTFYIGPLAAGTYDFFDDSNPDAKGTVVVR